MYPVVLVPRLTDLGTKRIVQSIYYSQFRCFSSSPSIRHHHVWGDYYVHTRKIRDQGHKIFAVVRRKRDSGIDVAEDNTNKSGQASANS